MKSLWQEDEARLAKDLHWDLCGYTLNDRLRILRSLFEESQESPHNPIKYRACSFLIEQYEKEQEDASEPIETLGKFNIYSKYGHYKYKFITS